jgi:hypothetical protein
MNRFLAAVVVGLFVPAAGRADLLPPGTKNIPIEYKIETDKEYLDWVFFVVRGSGGVQKVTLDPKTPVVIPGSGGVGNGPVPQPGEKQRIIPYRASALAAIPKDAVKKYATEKDLHAAVEDGKVEGMVRVKDYFSDHENAKATDPRKSITRRYKVTKIDAKGGVMLEPIKADDQPGKEEEEAASAARPTYTLVAAGLAVAGAIGFAGLWLVGRSRRPRETGT